MNSLIPRQSGSKNMLIKCLPTGIYKLIKLKYLPTIKEEVGNELKKQQTFKWPFLTFTIHWYIDAIREYGQIDQAFPQITDMHGMITI